MAGNNLPKPPPLTPKPPIRTTPPVRPFQNQNPPPLVCARPRQDYQPDTKPEVACKNRYCACKLTGNLTNVKSRAEARNLRKARGGSDPATKDGIDGKADEGKNKKKKRKTRSDKGTKRGPNWKGGDPWGGGGPRGGGGGPPSAGNCIAT